MKKFIASIVLAFAAIGANTSVEAATFWQNGVLYGNVCRAGLYYLILPYAPVGTRCYIDYNGVRWHGAISTE